MNINREVNYLIWFKKDDCLKTQLSSLKRRVVANNWVEIAWSRNGSNFVLMATRNCFVCEKSFYLTRKSKRSSEKCPLLLEWNLFPCLNNWLSSFSSFPVIVLLYWNQFNFMAFFLTRKVWKSAIPLCLYCLIPLRETLLNCQDLMSKASL